jgi:hypothetical protein
MASASGAVGCACRVNPSGDCPLLVIFAFELAYQLGRVSTCVLFRVDSSRGIFLERRWRTDLVIEATRRVIRAQRGI